MSFNISVSEIFPKCIHLHFETQYEVASTMMRLQEFYESPYENIKGVEFSIEEYMDTYANAMGNFTYTSDWTGFNIPGNIVDEFFETFSVLLDKEIHLKEIIDKAKKKAKIKDEHFYLIASYIDKVDGKDVLKHELCHALYYLDPEYSAEMDNNIMDVQENELEVLFKGLITQGYTKEVVLDEIQAYFSTSDMVQLCKDFVTEEIPWQHVLKCKQIFNKYYSNINTTS